MKILMTVAMLLALLRLQADPIIYAIAGAPASGKTTFIQEKIKQKFFAKDIFIHDCDAVMTSLEGYQSDLKLLGPAQAFANWELPARQIAESELMRAVEAKKTIIYDRSCALPTSYTFLKDLVENQGYTLIMHVLYVTQKEAIDRAIEREQKTRRHIPEELLVARMSGIKTLWPDYLKLAKNCYLYDSNDKSYKLIASQENAQLVILEPESYENFLHP